MTACSGEACGVGTVTLLQNLISTTQGVNRALMPLLLRGDIRKILDVCIGV